MAETDLSPYGPLSCLDSEWLCLGALSGLPTQYVEFCLVSGWKFAVSFLQNHLWRENWDPAPGEDGGVQVPGVPPWPRGLRNNTHSLQHSSRHSGKGALAPEEPLWIFVDAVPLPALCPLVTTGCPSLPGSGSQEPGGTSAGGYSKLLGLWKKRWPTALP